MIINYHTILVPNNGSTQLEIYLLEEEVLFCLGSFHKNWKFLKIWNHIVEEKAIGNGFQIGHFHVSKSLVEPSDFVPQHDNALDLSNLAEEVFQILFCYFFNKLAYKYCSLIFCKIFDFPFLPLLFSL